MGLAEGGSLCFLLDSLPLRTEEYTIFAALDYLRYRRRRGKYGRSGVLRHAFAGTDADTLWPLLRKGDLLLISTGRQFLSWLVMYITDSPLSHLATYIGNGKIAHMTTSGFAIEDIQSLEDEQTFILPMFIPALADDRRDRLDGLIHRMRGERYGWIPVILRGIRILMGRDPRAYRLRFLGDAFFLALLLQGLLFIFSSSLFFFWGFLTYASIVMICFLLPGHYHSLTPIRFYELMREIGARSILDMRADDTDTPTFVAANMQVFLPRRVPISLQDLKSPIELIGLTMGRSVLQQVSPTEANVTLRTTLFEGRFRVIYGNFEAEASRLKVPPDLALTECLTVRATSIEPTDVLAAAVFGCAFANRHGGYYFNIGLKSGFSPEQSLMIAKSLLESGLFTTPTTSTPG